MTWYEQNKQRALDGMKEWRARNPEKVSQYKQEWRQRNKIKTLEAQRKRNWKRMDLTYTSTTYDEMLAKQDGKCAVCGKPPGERRFRADYNLATSMVRGLLCGRCLFLNKWLDALDKDESLTKRVQKYRDVSEAKLLKTFDLGSESSI